MTTMNTSEKLWNYFKRNDDSKIGECKLCNKSISYASTITNLKIHLKLKHIEAYEVLLAYRTPSPEPPDVLYTVKKTSKNISANIWNYFERNDNTKIAKCNLCFKSLSYKSTSGNLRPHLSHKHPEAYQDFLAGRMLSLESRCKDSPARSPSPEPPSISNTGNTNSRNSYLKIWDYFKRNQRTKIGICNLCSKSLSYKTTTTNLKKHLMHKHIEAYKLLQGDPDDILNTVKRNSQNVSSNMWNYFQRNRRTRIGKCKLCNKLLSYKTSVTNLKKHLKHKHIEVYKDFQAERSPTPGPPCTLNTVKTTRKTYNRLWNYFQRNQNTKISKCNLCGKTLSYRSTVTNLRQHLQLKHIEAYEDLLAERTASPEPADILNTVNRNSRNSYIKLWNYFQRNQGTKMGTCNLCSKSLSYKTSSTNLRKHLKHKHIDAYEDLLAERTASPNPRHRDSLSRSSPEPKYEYSLSRSPSPESTHVHSLSRSSSQESRYTDPLTRSSPEPKGSLRSSSPKPRDKCSPLRSSFLESTYKDTVSRSPSESRYKDSPSRSPSPEAARWYRKGQLTKYFEYLDTKEDRARCNTCGGSYQFRSTVANLKAHLKKVHPDLYRELRLSEGAAVEDLDAEMDDVDVEKRPQRTIDLSEYFEKYEDDEDSSVTCILCKKSFSEESETTLAGHLFAEHSEQVEVRRSRNRSRPSEDAIWDFFEVLSCIEQTAKCNYCEERGSFANGNAELAIHLSRAHPDHFETYMERRLDMSQSDDEQSQRNRERAQRVRRRGKRSVLWEHFDAGDGRRALCRHCGHSISYKSTTGNLWLHLRASHPHQHALIDRDKRATGGAAVGISIEASPGRTTSAGTSPDWELFHKVDETKKLAKCSLCSKILSYGVSTSELTKHLQRHGFGLQVEQDAGDGGESREMKTCSVWEYFTRDCEDDFAKCNICLERVSFEGESSLFEHLKDRHKDIQILETETDDETVRAYKGSKSKKCSDSVFFKKNKDADSLKCTLCSEALSGDDEAHMARHLAEKHKHLGKEPATEHRGSDTERNGPGNRSRGSVVWHYFKVVDRRRMQARCSLCANTFSFMTSVSNLKKHLIKMHHLNFDNARDASNPLDKYFARSPDDGSVSCSLCEQPLEDGRKASLLQHLHDHHRPEAAEAEDGADDDPPRSGRNRLRSLSWRYFSIVDRRRSVARCALCAAHLSYFGTITNLKKHLLSKHRLDPARGRLPQDSPKYCSIWEYFTKSLDDDTVKCNMCKEILLYESERSLIEHMRAKHADIEILEQETDADSDQTDVETKPTPKVLRAWRHFKKTSSANKMAECKLCKMEVSYEDADNLLDHLKQHHSRKRSTSDADGSKKFTVSASGALYELEQEDNFDDNVQDENAIFLEEYKEPRPGSKILGKKARKRKRNSGQNHSDSDTSEDNLNIYKNIKEASTRDESLHHFSKYLVSLLRELPKDVSRKLQLDFIMQINEARTSRRPATVTNTRRSSSE